MSCESFQADTEEIGPAAVSEDQVAVTENVEGENPIQQEEDNRLFEEQFKELNERFDMEIKAMREEADRNSRQMVSRINLLNRSIRNACTEEINKATKVIQAEIRNQNDQIGHTVNIRLQEHKADLEEEFVTQITAKVLQAKKEIVQPIKEIYPTPEVDPIGMTYN